MSLMMLICGNDGMMRYEYVATRYITMIAASVVPVIVSPVVIAFVTLSSRLPRRLRSRVVKSMSLSTEYPISIRRAATVPSERSMPATAMNAAAIAISENERRSPPSSRTIPRSP